MANALKGEVELAADGKTYTLCFTTDAIVQVEQLLGANIVAISAQSQSVGTIRTLLWGALLTHHPDVDLVAAGKVLDDFEGGVTGAFEKIVRALRFRLSRVAVDAPLEEPKDSGDQ